MTAVLHDAHGDDMVRVTRRNTKIWQGGEKSLEPIWLRMVHSQQAEKAKQQKNYNPSVAILAQVPWCIQNPPTHPGFA